MKRTLRYTIRTAGCLVCLLILGWLALAGFVLVKKDALLKKAAKELKARTGGEASIGDMDVSFFRHFPNITIHLSKVVLRDSLWQQHRHDFLHTEHIYLQMALFRSLFSRKAQLGKIFLEQGTIYLFTDSTGYSNLVRLREQGAGGRDKELTPPDISLSDMKLVVENQDKHKLFDLDIHRLICNFKKDERSLLLGISALLQVNSLAFNTEKGGYLKDRVLSGNFHLRWNLQSRVLQADKVILKIDGHPFAFSGRFFPDVKPDPFLLDIQTEDILYRKASALLPPLIQQKLDRYDIDKPITIHAVIDAGAADDPTPQITVHTSLQRGSINTPIGRFNEVSFKGSFTNERIRGHKREDENSAVRLFAFSGSLQNIPIRSDTITITDLKHPLLDCDLRARFGLTQLNELTGSKTIQFHKGTCSMNINYRGPLSRDDSAVVMLHGGLEIDSGTVNYLPYGFQLADCNGKIRFRDQDVVVDRLDARAGSSKVSLKGSIRNIVPILARDANDVTINWALSSARLNLEDFMALLKKPASPTDGKEGQSLLGSQASRFDHILKEGVIHLQLEADDLVYKHFAANHARAGLLFNGKEIRLNNMDMNQGVAALHLSGKLDRQGGSGGNALSFQSHLEQVDLPRLFADFSNFGQQALPGKSLRGRLTADINMTGRLTNKASIVQNSFKGTVNFSIKEGQLLDFEPMEKINEKILKKRDLSEIHFAELKNQLDLDTTTLTIHRMEIQSTALTIFVEGKYDLKTGPDLSLQVPLSNLKGRSFDVPPANRGKDSRIGLSVRLRAKRGEDGNLKLSWDPFKKALRKKN